MIKYVHTFDGTEHEAPEGSLNWPWVPASSLDETYAETRAAARAYVAEQLEAAEETAAAVKRGPGRPRKAAEGSPDA